MADVKWIKITTDIFDDEKILLIESMPEKDSLIVIWFKLLCMAGKQNNSGVFTINDKIAYTDEMLATIFRRPVNTVRLALNVFQQYGMIDIVDGIITIPNWEKHQNIDQLEKLKEQTRKRVAAHREKQKILAENKECNVTCNVTDGVTVTLCNATDKIREEKKREDKNKEGDKEEFCKQVADLFNSLCPSLPSIINLTESRKKKILKMMNNFSNDIGDYKILFTKAEESDFLKGKNNRNWTASFDWLMNAENSSKVIEGNFDNRTAPAKKGRYDFEALERMSRDKINSVYVKGNPELEKKAEELKKELQKNYK